MSGLFYEIPCRLLRIAPLSERLQEAPRTFSTYFGADFDDRGDASGLGHEDYEAPDREAIAEPPSRRGVMRNSLAYARNNVMRLSWNSEYADEEEDEDLDDYCEAEPEDPICRDRRRMRD
jgi:hypothetical protein